MIQVTSQEYVLYFFQALGKTKPKGKKKTHTYKIIVSMVAVSCNLKKCTKIQVSLVKVQLQAEKSTSKTKQNTQKYSKLYKDSASSKAFMNLKSKRKIRTSVSRKCIFI